MYTVEVAVPHSNGEKYQDIVVGKGKLILLHMKNSSSISSHYLKIFPITLFIYWIIKVHICVLTSIIWSKHIFSFLACTCAVLLVTGVFSESRKESFRKEVSVKKVTGDFN